MSLLFLSHPKETDLALFAGGELGPLARWRIERHLQQCDGCQEAVADFFHLQSEVSELADTPVVDWNTLAREIGARVRLEAPPADTKATGWAAHPRAWQLGLATATALCAFLIVKQLPTIQNSARQAAPQTESQVLDQAVTAANSAGASEPQIAVATSEQSRGPVAALQLAQEASRGDKLALEVKKSAVDSLESEQAASPSRTRQDENFRAGSDIARAVVPDLEAQAAPAAPAPLLEQAREAVAPGPGDRPGALAFAAPLADQASAEKASEDLRQRPAPAFGAAAPPPPATAPSATVAPAEADAAVSRDRMANEGARGSVGGTRRNRAASEPNARAELAQVPKAETRSALDGIQTAALARKTDANDVWPAGPGFTVLPAALEDPAVDVGVAADGRISVRSVDASTSTITITDVYVP